MMTAPEVRRVLAAVAAAATLVACTADESVPASPIATASPSALSTPAASASSSEATSPTEAPTTSPSATATPETSGSTAPTAFAVAPNADADALFAIQDSCRNPQDGYVLAYPDSWYTNTEIRDVPACSWFSPSFYTVDDFDPLPPEIAIEIFWIEGDRGYTTDVLGSEDGLAGGQYATRVEVAGTAADATDGESYEYLIQLGRTREEGPNLVARTDSGMGGDYELNRAVLDRIVASMEFIGSVQ